MWISIALVLCCAMICGTALRLSHQRDVGVAIAEIQGALDAQAGTYKQDIKLWGVLRDRIEVLESMAAKRGVFR